MSKKDEAIAEIERVLAELKKGEKESAATAIVGQSRGNAKITGVFNKFLKILFVVLLLLVIAYGSVLLLNGSTFKKESTTFVEQFPAPGAHTIHYNS